MRMSAMKATYIIGLIHGALIEAYCGGQSGNIGWIMVGSIQVFIALQIIISHYKQAVDDAAEQKQKNDNQPLQSFLDGYYVAADWMETNVPGEDYFEQDGG